MSCGSCGCSCARLGQTARDLGWLAHPPRARDPSLLGTRGRQAALVGATADLRSRVEREMRGSGTCSSAWNSRTSAAGIWAIWRPSSGRPKIGCATSRSWFAGASANAAARFSDVCGGRYHRRYSSRQHPRRNGHPREDEEATAYQMGQGSAHQRCPRPHREAVCLTSGDGR
jgi:hypothetical protein